MAEPRRPPPPRSYVPFTLLDGNSPAFPPRPSVEAEEPVYTLPIPPRPRAPPNTSPPRSRRTPTTPSELPSASRPPPMKRPAISNVTPKLHSTTMDRPPPPSSKPPPPPQEDRDTSSTLGGSSLTKRHPPPAKPAPASQSRVFCPPYHPGRETGTGNPQTSARPSRPPPSRPTPPLSVEHALSQNPPKPDPRSDTASLPRPVPKKRDPPTLTRITSKERVENAQTLSADSSPPKSLPPKGPPPPRPNSAPKRPTIPPQPKRPPHTAAKVAEYEAPVTGESFPGSVLKGTQDSVLKVPIPTPRKSPPQIKKSHTLSYQRHSPSPTALGESNAGCRKSPSLHRKRKDEEEEEEGGVRALTYSALAGRQSGGDDRPPGRTESSTDVTPKPRLPPPSTRTPPTARPPPTSRPPPPSLTVNPPSATLTIKPSEPPPAKSSLTTQSVPVHQNHPSLLRQADKRTEQIKRPEKPQRVTAKSSATKLQPTHTSSESSSDSEDESSRQPTKRSPRVGQSRLLEKPNRVSAKPRKPPSPKPWSSPASSESDSEGVMDRRAARKEGSPSYRRKRNKGAGEGDKSPTVSSPRAARRDQPAKLRTEPSPAPVAHGTDLQCTHGHFAESTAEIQCQKSVAKLAPRPSEVGARSEVRQLLTQLQESGQIVQIENHVGGIPSGEATSVDKLSLSITPSQAKYLSHSDKAQLHNHICKAYAIYFWIAKNISYDIESFMLHLRSPGGNMSSICEPNTVLRRGMTICAGYSKLFKALATKAHLEVMEINGASKPPRNDGLVEDPRADFVPCKSNLHAWNAVKLNGVWFLLDCTFGSGYCDPSQRFVPKFNRDYFASPSERFIFTHFPEDNSWQLLHKPLSLREIQPLISVPMTSYGRGIEPQTWCEYIHIPKCSSDPFTQLHLRVKPGTNIQAQLLPLDPSLKTDRQRLASEQLQLHLAKYTNTEQIGHDVYIRAVLPQPGCYYLNVLVESSAPSSLAVNQYDSVLSYLIQCDREPPSDHLGYPSVYGAAASEIDFKLLEWNPCEKPYVAETSQGRVNIVFRARPSVRFHYCLYSGQRDDANLPTSNVLEYNTMVSHDPDDPSLYVLQASFPSEGWWTIYLAASKDSNAAWFSTVMTYKIFATVGVPSYSYPQIFVPEVSFELFEPIVATMSKPLVVPFIMSSSKLLDFQVDLAFQNESAERMQGYGKVETIRGPVKTSCRKYQLKVKFPKQGKWYVLVVRKDMVGFGGFSSQALFCLCVTVSSKSIVSEPPTPKPSLRFNKPPKHPSTEELRPPASKKPIVKTRPLSPPPISTKPPRPWSTTTEEDEDENVEPVHLNSNHINTSEDSGMSDSWEESEVVTPSRPPPKVAQPPIARKRVLEEPRKLEPPVVRFRDPEKPKKPPRPLSVPPVRPQAPKNLPSLAADVNNSSLCPPLPPRPNPGHPLYRYVCCEPHGIAIAHHQAYSPDELSYQWGDVIELIERVDEHWYFARNADCGMQEGLILGSDLNIVKRLPGQDTVAGFEEGPCAIAMHEFHGQSMDELSFKAGDLIMLKARVGEQWLKGKLIGGQEGIFPKEFVEIVEDLPEGDTAAATTAVTEETRGPHCVVVYTFTAEGEGELSLTPGDIIELVERVGEQWLKGKLREEEGIFPVEFVEIIVDLPSPPSPSPQESQPAEPRPSPQHRTAGGNVATALYDFDGQEGELSFKTGDVIKLVARVNPEWVRGEVDGRSGILPSNFVDNVPHNLPAAEEETHKQPTGKCEALFDFQSEASGELSFSPGEVITTTEWVNEEWMRGTIREREGMFPINFVKVLEELPKQEKHSATGTEVTPRSTQLTDNLQPKAVALFDFTAGSDQEISFKVGDTLNLLSKVNSEWYMGENTRTTQIGEFPSNFVDVTVPLP